MALPAAGSAISFKDINEEIGNNSQAELDLKTAGETFGDTQPFGMNELAGLSSARLQLTIKYLVQIEQGESNRDTGWISDTSLSEINSTKGELVLCAEAAAVSDDVRENGLEYTVDTETTDFNSDGTVSNGDTLFNSNSGATLSSRRPDSGLINQESFLCETTQNNIFQVNSSGVISNVRSRTPNVPTKPTLVADSGTQITVTIPTTNTAVTREFDIHRSIGGASFARVGTVVPSDSGSIDDTSISTTFVDSSGISAGNSVVYKVFAQNAFATSSASTTSDSVTTPAGTSWSNLSGDPQNLNYEDGGFAVSNAASIDLTNGSGNTVITLSTSNAVGTLEIAYSTSGDPGAGGTSNGGSGFGSSGSHRTIASGTYSSGTLHFRTKFTHQAGKVATGTYTVTFTNNSVADNNFNGNLSSL